eukprot:312802-Chlamydomonas_euryale.AAC.4
MRSCRAHSTCTVARHICTAQLPGAVARRILPDACDMRCCAAHMHCALARRMCTAQRRYQLSGDLPSQLPCSWTEHRVAVNPSLAEHPASLAHPPHLRIEGPLPCLSFARPSSISPPPPVPGFSFLSLEDPFSFSYF